MANANATGRAHHLLVQCTVPGFFLSHHGSSGTSGLEYEATLLVEVFANQDSGAFISQGGESVNIAPIMGRGSWPSIMS